jgi:recombination protein RecT
MSTDIAQKEGTMSERFMNKVMAEFTSGVGEIALTSFQKRLAQNYFIALDASLKLAEEKRAKKSEKYRDALPVTWANVNMEGLARNVVSAARIGLDPAQKNHINMMPFKNGATNKYEIVFVEGYRGIELKSKKYGLNVPDHVVVELVYSTDKFKSYKKDRHNNIETYDFEITNDFDRGKIVGGFYYHIYENHPDKNKLVVMTLKDIEKRKPAYASPEFWGGEKDKWENGKKVGTEPVEGWYEKMVYKTVYRAAYSDITIDSQKIDDDYMKLRQMEMSLTELKVAQEIEENANSVTIEADYRFTDQQQPEPQEAPQEPPGVSAQPPSPGPGPGF